jgi:hypothetical protein
MKSLLCKPLSIFLKELFSIHTNENAQRACDVLLLETGDDFCCYALCNRASTSIQKLTYYSLEPLDESDELTKVITNEKVLTDQLQQVYISSALPQAILIPEKYFQNESAEELFKSTYHLNGAKIAYDIVPDWQIMVMYQLPQQKFVSELPDVKFLHHYSASLKSHREIKTKNWISIHFTPRQFRIIVNKDQQLKLVQTYSYTAPLDVAYYLIRIFDEFSCSHDTAITISGLVEEDSALLKELHKYFLNISFHQPASNTVVGQEQYPQHFFSSMYNLAACVL